jgi:hypothetical protein
MKRAFVFSLILALLISTSFWLCPFVVGQQQTGPTLTIASGPGGSIVVQSYAINKGQAVTEASGEDQSWVVPYGASVTLKATDFASGLKFRGWTGPLNGKPFNPATIVIEKFTTSIKGIFEAEGAPNSLGVTLQPLANATYKQKAVPVTFTIVNPNWAYFRLKVTGVRFYLDGKLFYWVETSRVARSSEPKSYSYNSTLTALSEGEHSLYLVAVAQFEQARELPRTMPGTPVPASGISEMTYFTVDTTAPHILILSPEANVYGGSDVPLNFVVNEATSRIAYSLDGGVKATVGENVTLSELSVGAHNVTVCAWDSVGNLGASETITFAIAKPELFPTSQLIAAAIVASVVFVCFGLVAYTAKLKKQTSKSGTVQ